MATTLVPLGDLRPTGLIPNDNDRITPDHYISSIVAKYAVAASAHSPALTAANRILPALRQWAGPSLLDIQLSGSYAKGTAISLSADLDLFLSFDTRRPVRDIYWSLYRQSIAWGLAPRAQNVSFRIQLDGTHIDIVPGRRQRNTSADHTLYKRKQDSWVQTNIAEHIRLVRRSGRADEIRALKIFRHRHHLDFPSFYLELTAIRALAGQPILSLAGRLARVFRYLATDLPTARVLDPANSNNVISDDLDPDAKRRIVEAANQCLIMRNWTEILW